MALPKKVFLSDVSWQIGKDVDGLHIRKDQEITDEFLTDLKDRRFDSVGTREGEYMHVASIPVAVIEKWMREGFNILNDRNITYKQIVARLKAEGLDAFLATNKRV